MQIDTARITQAVTLSQACELYGIPINRQGFSRCPFHSGDNTPSFKIYPDNRGFYCFACGAGGDVITFARKLLDLDFIGAVKKLNSDFSLGLEEKPSYSEYREARRLQAEREQKKREKADLIKELCKLCTLHRIYWQIIKKYKGGEPNKLEAEALHNIEFVRYKIEVRETELAELNC